MDQSKHKANQAQIYLDFHLQYFKDPKCPATTYMNQGIISMQPSRLMVMKNRLRGEDIEETVTFQLLIYDGFYRDVNDSDNIY